MARIKVTPSLPDAVRFTDVGVSLPKRTRRGGGKRKQRIRRLAGEVSRQEVWFLRDASFSVARGESLAVVGYRGAGREQVLRLAAGTLVPDEGTVERGLAFVPILGLGAALHRNYTVRQNIYLIGALLGMSSEDVGAQLDLIVERAGVAKILDKYLGESSKIVRGRLVWSVAMATGAAGFCVNQALVVGQPDFQATCWEVVEQLKAEGVTFLVTSERPSHLLRFCDRAILLDQGRIIDDTTVQSALTQLKSLKPPKGQVHFVIEELDDADEDDEFM